MEKAYLSTNLKNDETLNINDIYKLKINIYRNGNLDLISIKSGLVVLELQNNKIEPEDLI
jgi:hypothetical protein